MTIGKTTARIFTTMWAALMLALAPQAAFAQDQSAAVVDRAAATQAAPAANATGAAAVGAVDDKADASTINVAPGADAYVPMKPTPGKGMPVDGRITLQDQYSPTGHYGLWMHDWVLMPIITAISLLVLVLLLYVVFRFRRGRNPVPSRTTHNTFIEIVWTLVPVLVLVAIAIPSITLLAHQYESAPKNAVTVKVTGYQWYWGYTYPDNGGFEVISNMLPDAEADKRGEPHHLAVDNRMVVPAGEWIRIQTTAADVIHSFAVPSLWFKLDAVPGRLNERRMFIDQPGVYYGQCSELCGIKHGYMPIAVEALPRPKWEAWVRSQGGTVGKPAAAAAPAVAPLQQPESAAQKPEGAAASATAAPAPPATT
ncbi:MAG: cytochrome c oxidase subunit II [Tsuneonella sp.]